MTLRTTSGTVLGDLLRDAAADAPEAPAVVDGTSSLSYGELDETSDRMARLLVDIGIARGDRVGLLIDKSATAVASIYGVLKAGAAYVPIDAKAPTSRAAYIADNCGVRCLVSGEAQRETWAQLVDGAPKVEHLLVPDLSDGEIAVEAPVRTWGADAVAAQPPGTCGVRVVDQDVAYILYTSGSTGEPKGVTLTHRNAMAFVRWAAEEFGVGPSDRLSSHAPFHFDLSVFDLYAAAYGGAALVLAPVKTSVFPIEAARFIREQQISVWYSVPSILSAMTNRGGLTPGDFPDLRTMLFAGEVFPTKYLRDLMGLLPHVRFANLYGPTETNVCTWYEVPTLPADMDDTIPIGRPIPDDDIYVVTEDGRRAGPGEVGELCVRGATVMRGYWGDPERTARSLVPDPFAEAFPDLMYRTGDLARWEDDGNLRFIGRRDSQIKSRGYRIELGEIESALSAHPAVSECAVIAIPDEQITNRIKAYVVGGATQQDLVHFCRQRIPSYMIPQSFEFRDALPKSSTGKLDRRALERQETETT